MAAVWYLLPCREKLPPGALMGLPDELLADIFTIWLLLPDVCRLDSAVCAKRWRSDFLTLILTNRIRFLREEIDVLDSKSLSTKTHGALSFPAAKWVLLRKIHLVSLCLPCDENITDTDQAEIGELIISLLNNGLLDKLETVALTNCTYLERTDLAKILSKNFSTIRSLDITGWGSPGPNFSSKYIKGCTGLKAFCPKGNEVPEYMVDIIKSFRKLQKLSFYAVGETITNDVVQSVADNCHSLEHLDLTYCTDISDAPIRSVAKSCPLLQFINLRGIILLTDDAVVELCRTCTYLQDIDLGDCGLLTDQSVLAVAELPGLRSICLKRISTTSAAVQTLARRCRGLRYIDIAYCANICDITLREIAEQCSKLEELYVEGCPNVTSTGLTLIAYLCKNISTVSHTKFNNLSYKSLILIYPMVMWCTRREIVL